MSLVELRAQFEQDILKKYPRGINLNRRSQNENSGYTSTKTQGMWLGYMLYHSSSWSVETEENSRPVGKFIVARIDEKGLLWPARRPWLHPTKRQAKDESRILCMKHESSFAILRCIDVKHPKDVDTTTESDIIATPTKEL